ncbi:PQ-loop-domain-containing protein [Flagelloscypha sp. PMI_526]|nr:PQ-loop-domain-containing protein [Flagelloscypha sp. PMI_526]
MLANPVAENVFGTLGTVCWTIQVVPQLVKSFKTKNTEGLSPILMLTWGIGAAPLGVYVIVQDLNVPLIVQPQIFGVLCLIGWGQCLYYGAAKRPHRTAILLTVGVMLLLGFFELLMVIALRSGYGISPFDRTPLGKEKPGVLFFGILSAILISLGLLPQYYEIWIHREVKGVSKLFMFVDALGGVFSVLSLAFKEKFDTTASVTYCMVTVLDGIVLLLALILNPLARRRRNRGQQIVAPISENANTSLSMQQLST